MCNLFKNCLSCFKKPATQTSSSSDPDPISLFKGQPRLPKFAFPKRYDIHLKPDLAACIFQGNVSIDLEIVADTRFIVLDASHLSITPGSVSFSHHNKVFEASKVGMVEADEILVLDFAETLPKGMEVLAIGFDGVLNDNMKGFYRSTYLHNGEMKNMSVTQFEPAYARQCFPCWDEPAFKAKFKITLLDVPSELVALSNMPVTEEKLNGNLKTVHYQESPVMSTYLVAVVFGLFDYIEHQTTDGTKVRVYCQAGKANQGKFALDVAVRTLAFYKYYFDMQYPLPKLDMVAIPDFAAGAMENYGLVTYREMALLYDDQHSAAANKQRMSYMVKDKLFPEWKIWTQFLDRESSEGLRLDGLAESHPIEVEVNHASEIDEIFDSISYRKGASVIRMLQNYVGDQSFQNSLATYIKRHAWSNARTEDLWAALKEGCNKPVNQIMNSWTKQKGYPVVSVKMKNQKLEIEQTQFLYSGSRGDGHWIIPVTLCYGEYNTSISFMLEKKSETRDIMGLFSDTDLKSRDPARHFHIKQFFIGIFLYPAERLGWDPKQGESHLDAMSRGYIFTALAMLGHEETLKEATSRFQAFLSNRSTPKLHPDIRKAAYVAVMQKVSSSNKAGFESLLRVYRETDLSQEKTRVLGSLASCPDQGIVLEALNFALFAEVGSQDACFGLDVSKEGREVAWKWLKDNWHHIWTTYGSGFLVTRFVSSVVSPFASAEKVKEVKEFFADRTKPSIARTLKQSIEQVQINAKWVQSIQNEKDLPPTLKKLAIRKN
ncbi:hypothetical protein PTKIN_Ptkin03bG0211400 [Pterospermum kingtungense]